MVPLPRRQWFFLASSSHTPGFHSRIARMASTQYAVHSVVRSRHNRTERASLPHNPRRKQYIGANQHRLTHGRALIITEEYLLAHLDELREKAACQILEVRTLDGSKVDLRTLVSTAPPKAAVTKPEFPMDSVNNDKNFPGLAMVPPYMSDDISVPQVLKPGEVPALFEDAEAVAEGADDPVINTTAEEMPVDTPREEAPVPAPEPVVTRKKRGR